MFDTPNHSLAMPLLVPPSKLRRSGFAESRVIDDPATVRRALKRMEHAEKRVEKSAETPIAALAIER